MYFFQFLRKTRLSPPLNCIYKSTAQNSNKFSILSIPKIYSRCKFQTRFKVVKFLGVFGYLKECFLFVCEKTEKTSQYKGVSFHKESGKWYAFFRSTAGKKKFCGSFNDELDAAKQVNQLCEEMKITPKNPEILGMPTQPYHVT